MHNTIICKNTFSLFFFYTATYTGKRAINTHTFKKQWLLKHVLKTK